MSTTKEKPSAALSVANSGIDVPGVAITRNACVFKKTLSLDQLNALAAHVTELQGGVAWWLGDVGLEIQARNREANEREAQDLDKKARRLERDLEHVEGKEREELRDTLRMIEKRAAELRADKGDHYRAKHAEMLGIDAGYWANCVMVARFFAPSSRDEGLSHMHHRVALYAAGGTEGKVADAVKWLRRAAKGNWSAADMRREVNQSLATAQKEPPPMEDPFAELVPADRWAITAKARVPKMSDDEAIKLFTMTQALREFLAELAARVNSIQSAPALRQETPEALSINAP